VVGKLVDELERERAGIRPALLLDGQGVEPAQHVGRHGRIRGPRQKPGGEALEVFGLALVEVDGGQAVLGRHGGGP
jgi:hypothetical protein